MPFCSSGGARIHYEVSGIGEPLVLIAGTGFDLTFWDDLLPSLSGYRVLRLDNRGAGLSDLPGGELTIQQMADDVVAVMDEVGMDVAHVHGASMGGLIAQDLAIRHGERVLSLVLGATWAGSAPMSGAIRALPLLLSRKEPEELLRAGAPYLSVHPVVEDGAPFPGHALAERRSTMLRQQLGAQVRYSSLRRLRRIRTPTLVLHGAQDRLISPLNARLLARRIPGARLRLIRGAGHLYHRDQPEQAREELLAFLLDAAGQLLDERDLDLPRDTASREVSGTVLLTDIVGSTSLAASLGDHAWAEILRQHDDLSMRSVEAHGGIRIKGTGDGVLALFDEADGAARCALALREHLLALGLTIRAGVHSGTFLVAGDDLHGLGLHVAARVMASAADGGLRLSDSSRDLLPPGSVVTRSVGEHLLRGLPGTWAIHELLATA